MRNLLPVLFVLFLLVALALATAVGIVVFMSGATNQQVATVLTYEIDRTSLSEGDWVDTADLIAAIDARLNPGFSRVATVGEDKEGRIAVGVFGDDPARRAHVQRLLSLAGRLEIHALANSEDHQPLIDRAQKAKGREIRNQAGDLEARWLPVHEGVLGQLETDSAVIRRGDQAGFEVLVRHDDLNVDRDSLKNAEAITDQLEGPSVVLRFNSAGQRQLTALIEATVGGSFFVEESMYRLGIVLDGQIYSIVNLTGYYPGQDISPSITGNYTSQDMENVAKILNGAPLPALLIPGEIRKVTP